MAARLRLVSLLAAVMLAVVIGAGTLSLKSDDASANIVPGDFSQETTAPAVVALGSFFDVGARNDHTGMNYQSAQWFIDYDELFMLNTPGQTAATTRDPAAPAGACTSYNDNGVRTLLGCLDLGGPNLTYSGNTWTVEYSCIAPTAAHTWVLFNPGVSTFVRIGAVNQPQHIHEAVTACVPTADLVTTKTATPSVVAGGVVTNTIVVENTGPQPATSVGVIDDLPDAFICLLAGVPNASCVGGPTGTLDIDADGDSVNEIVGVPCVFAPAVPAIPPFPALTNAVICSAGATVIQPGGSATANIQYETTADSCNQTLIDLGAGVSLDANPPFFPGPGIPDPDFFDGVQLPPAPGSDDNFDIGITQVGDCPVTIVKTVPAGGAVGNADVFTLTVSNAGPSAATNVNVTDVVPAGLTVTSVVPALDCAATVGNNVDCTFASIASGGNVVITINFTEDVAGTYCNTADVTWVRAGGGAASDGPECFTVIPPFNGLVKSIDPDGNDTDGIDNDGDTVVDEPGEGPLAPIVPETGEDTILINLWLCTDQATDGIDNDGNSTVDDEPETCDGNGEGELDIIEAIFTREDCDTRNDDDDDDGLPVSNSPTIHPIADADLIDNDGDTVVDEPGERDPNVNIPNPAYRPECPSPTLEDYIQGLVDKDGGELPEGLGAFEFQLKFDHKIFDVDFTEATFWANGRVVNCTMTIVSENDVRFGCVTTGANLGFPQVSGVAGVTIHLTPEADLPFRIRPGKDNGVTRRLLDENCEVADIYGDIFPFTNAGLTPDCTDLDITIRRLEGDVDMDCDVDLQDTQRIAFRYGSFFGQLLYNQIYDLEPFVTSDFDIDIKDLQFVFGRVGSTCADPIPDNQDPIPAEGVGQP